MGLTPDGGKFPCCKAHQRSEQQSTPRWWWWQSPCRRAAGQLRGVSLLSSSGHGVPHTSDIETTLSIGIFMHIFLCFHCNIQIFFGTSRRVVEKFSVWHVGRVGYNIHYYVLFDKAGPLTSFSLFTTLNNPPFISSNSPTKWWVS